MPDSAPRQTALLLCSCRDADRVELASRAIAAAAAERELLAASAQLNQLVRKTEATHAALTAGLQHHYTDSLRVVQRIRWRKVRLRVKHWMQAGMSNTTVMRPSGASSTYAALRC